MRYLIMITLLFFIATPAIAELTREERAVRIKNLQEEREKIYNDYRILLEELNKGLAEKLIEFDKIQDLKQKRNSRANLFKDINQKRNEARSSLNTKSWEITSQEKDLKQGGDGDLEALRKKSNQRVLPPDFNERNKKLTESLMTKKNNTPAVPVIEETQPLETPSPTLKEEPIVVPSDDSFDWFKGADKY